jgi:hypothetical protein
VKTVTRIISDFWNGTKLVIPLICILLCAWLFVSLITSGSSFRDALALGVSSGDLSQGDLITRCVLLAFSVLFSIVYSGHKLRAAVEHAVTQAGHSSKTPLKGDSIFGDR